MNDLPVPSKVEGLENPSFSISEAAKQIGVHPETLRRWERKGGLKPFRTNGGQRRYSSQDLAAFKNGGNNGVPPEPRLGLLNNAEVEVGQHLSPTQADQAIASIKDSLKQLESSLQASPAVPPPAVPHNHSHPAPAPRSLGEGGFAGILVSFLLFVLLVGGAVSAFYYRPELVKQDVLNPLVSSLLAGGGKVEGTMRFLSTIFFGETDSYFVSPLGDVSFRNLRAKTVISDKQEAISFQAESITTDDLIVKKSQTIANLNSDFLDSLDSSSFLRSDTSATFSSGTLTLASGTAFQANGTATFGSTLAVSGKTDLSGLLNVAGLLTAANGLTLSAGALTLPAASIADSYLSANVPLKSTANTFTAAQTVSNANLLVTGTSNVGIGTTGPEAKLTVQDGTADPSLVFKGRSTDNHATIRFRGNADPFDRSHFYNVGADLVFGTGGTSTSDATGKVRITSSGNVGIGTAGPNYKLEVNTGAIGVVGSAAVTGQITLDNTASTNGRKYRLGPFNSARLFEITDITGASASRFAIDENGNVGIGTAGPLTKLHIEGGLGVPIARLAYTDGGTVVGDVQAAIEFRNLDASVGTPKRTASVKAINTDVTFGRTGRLGFFTATDGSGFDTDTETERLTILGSSGNVGIGTTSPDTRLHVSLSTAGTPTLLKLDNPDTALNSASRLEFQVGAATGIARIDGIRTATADNQGALAFYTRNAAGSAPERMRINSNGDFALGTLSVNRGGFTPGSRFLAWAGGSSTVPGVVLEPLGILTPGDNDIFRIRATRVTSADGAATGVAEMRFVSGNANDSTYMSFWTTPAAGALTERMRITDSGNVLIGTTTNPGLARLLVSATAGSGFSVAGSDGSLFFRVLEDSPTIGQIVADIAGAGTGFAVCHSVSATATDNVQIVDCTSAPSADYAEMYPVSLDVDYGDLVATGGELVPTFSSDENGRVLWDRVEGKVSRLVKTDKGYQGNLIGVVSNNYGDFTSAGHNIKASDNPKPVSLNGRVLVKVSTENGVINPGDPLTSSATIPGYAMKATSKGRTIGIALEPLTEGTGKLMVFINPGWSDPGTAVDTDGQLMANGKKLIAETVEAEEVISNKLLVTSMEAGAAIIRNLTVTIEGVFTKLTAATARITEAVVEKLSVGNLEVGEKAKINKLEMIDQVTGTVYCTWIAEGEWEKVKGACPDN